MVEGEFERRLEGLGHVALARMVGADPIADAGRLGDAAAHVVEPDAAEQTIVAPVQDVEGVAAVLVPVERGAAQRRR